MKKKNRKDVDPAIDWKDCRFRHMCKPHSIYTMLNSMGGDQTEIVEHKKQLLKSAGFGSLLQICNWTKIPSEFTKFVVQNFEPEDSQVRLSKYEVLQVKVEDIERVYCLPCEGINVDLNSCREKDITDLRKEFDLGVTGIANIERVSVKDMEAVILQSRRPETWCKAILIYILGCLLCPDNYEGMSLRYAGIVADIRKVASYNWCDHILNHLKKGTRLRTPKADLHFFMIHYIERMGPESPLSRGLCSKPTLKDWNVKEIIRKMESIREHCGFARGITVGYSNRPDRGCDPQELLTFDPENCPILKVPGYKKFVEDQIHVFKGVLQQLDGRLGIGIDQEMDDKYANVNDAADISEADQNSGQRCVEVDAEGENKKIDEPLVLRRSTRKTKIDVSEQLNKRIEDNIEEESDLDTIVKVACQTPLERSTTTRSRKNLMEISPPSFNLLSQSPTPVKHNLDKKFQTPTPVKQNLDEKFEQDLSNSEKIRRAYSDCVEYLEENIVYFEAAAEMDQNTMPKPLAYISPVVHIVDDDVDDDGEGQWKVLTSQKKVSSVEQYKARRRRVRKLSIYLKSPYDVHVHNSKTEEANKNLVTFVWSQDLNEHEPMYDGKRDNIFNLIRSDLYSLQENEWVSSLVIDNWANYLNMEARPKQRKRIVLTCESSINTLRDVTRANAIDRRSQAIAAKDFIQKLQIFNSHMDVAKLDVTKLEYIFLPALAKDHYVTYVLNLKMGRYEYLNSDPGFPRRRNSGTFSVFEALGVRLINEARSFVAEQYLVSGKQCPHPWHMFEWYDANMPQSKDGTSCGVMTMKFLQEWDGNEGRMESFRNWNRNNEGDLKLLVNQLRIDLCCAIVNHKNNKLKDGKENIQKMANMFCKEILNGLVSLCNAGASSIQAEHAHPKLKKARR